MLKIMNDWVFIIQAVIAGNLMCIAVEYILYKVLISSKSVRRWLKKEAAEYINFMMMDDVEKEEEGL